MSAWFAEWYNENEQRAYPLDDAATALDDAGVRLANDILVDAFIRWPLELGRRAFVSTVTLSPKLMTATILACPEYPGSDPLSFVPLASVSASRTKVGAPIAVTPYQSGVAGWVVFGSCDQPTVNHVFSDPSQSLLLPRAAEPTKAATIPGVTLSGTATRLTGDVGVTGSGDMSVSVVDNFTVRNGPDDYATVKAVVLQLAGTDLSSLLLKYRGPCGDTPESGTCNHVAIKTVNGITVGDDGVMSLCFTWPIVPSCLDNAIVLDCELGMADICSTTPVSL
jgi:hypothetical protein